jgi:hypothetical protein
MLTLNRSVYSTSRNKLSNAQIVNSSSIQFYSAGSACEGRAERKIVAVNKEF